MQHTTKENDQSIVNASFHVTHWSVQPYGTGISRMKYVGFVFGGDVLRFFHGGDECLTIPGTWTREPDQKLVRLSGIVVHFTNHSTGIYFNIFSVLLSTKVDQ